MYGPPGTGKTLMARACAAQTEATFLKLAGPQLVQMFIGDGAKLVRDCFALAKEKAPAIIFIDELDAVGTKRFDSEKSGDREVQRTMLELLNQLDGFASDDRIKVLAATNRVDVLDPALLRSGRLDRKIEFPLPNEEARAQILKIHSRKMKVNPGVNWGELARSTDEFGGAMLKAVCVEAGMIALRSGKNQIGHEHYVDAIAEVQAKKKDVSIDQNLRSIIVSMCLANTFYSRLSTFTHNLFFSHLRRRIMGWQALVCSWMQRRWMASDTACGIGIEGGKVKAWEDACNQPYSWQRRANSVDGTASFAKRIEYREKNKKKLISMDNVYLFT